MVEVSFFGGLPPLFLRQPPRNRKHAPKTAESRNEMGPQIIRCLIHTYSPIVASTGSTVPTQLQRRALFHL